MGVLNSWNPLGLSRPVMGSLYIPVLWNIKLCDMHPPHPAPIKKNGNWYFVREIAGLCTLIIINNNNIYVTAIGL
jgi:hypothetical protein